jgi:hypothetical protein
MIWAVTRTARRLFEPLAPICLVTFFADERNEEVAALDVGRSDEQRLTPDLCFDVLTPVGAVRLPSARVPLGVPEGDQRRFPVVAAEAQPPLSPPHPGTPLPWCSTACRPQHHRSMAADVDRLGSRRRITRYSPREDGPGAEIVGAARHAPASFPGMQRAAMIVMTTTPESVPAR